MKSYRKNIIPFYLPHVVHYHTNNIFLGVYYLYFESSAPSQPGDKATLVSDPDLLGCFCVRLHKYQYLGPNGGANSLVVFANNALLVNCTEESKWEDLELQIDTTELTQVRIICFLDFLRKMNVGNVFNCPG